MIFRIALAFLLSYFSALVYASADAPGTVSGGIIVPVVDGNDSSCIDITKKSVTMLILGLKAQRYSSWFSHSTSLGTKINVTIAGPTGANVPNFEFPSALALAPIGNGDVVTLPIHNYSIMSGYRFVDGSGNPFADITLDFSLIDITGNTPLASTVTSLISFSKSLSLPPNPFQTGVAAFGSFVNSLISSETDANNSETLATVGSQLYQGYGNCAPSQLHEGTFAIIYDFVSSGGLFAHHGNAPRVHCLFQVSLRMVESRLADKTNTASF